MPSCRIRRATFPRSAYSYLLDGTETLEVNPQSPNDQELLVPQRRVASLQPWSGNDVHHGSEATTSRPRSKTTTSGQSRGRSATTRSRDSYLLPGRSHPGTLQGRSQNSVARIPSYGLVANHFGSRRSRFTRSTSEAPASNEVAVHGSQLDILVPNEQRSGLVENALDQSINDQSEEEHEDDIVEHLEAIDPYVATVSHLSNAANSILIPPMSLYSRRPVIHLPKSPDPSLLASEKGHKEHMHDLDRHVEHVLRKRDRLRRTVAGIWSFVKTPMGIITALYGFCVVFWGAAIVLFLLDWIPTGSKDRQSFWVEVSSQVENALFTVTGIGLLPWRIIDTYRILQIWKLKRISARLRREAGHSDPCDEDDLPDPQYDPNHVPVLTDKQQKELHHQQEEFAKSQTWYRPHGTESHRAFPIGTALLICLFVDGNSFFQAMLCACMWSMNRFERPAWTTGTLIPASFLCGIIAAILIWRGGQKTKRTKEVEETLRAALEVEQQTDVLATDVAATQDQADPNLASHNNLAIPSPELSDNFGSRRTL